VLLVEDHEDTRLMYAEFLAMSFRVETAREGASALQLAKASRPDIVVTDLSLPGLDGFGLIAGLRADPALAGIPVVCLSGFGGSAHEARAREAGCDRILQKPCMPDALAGIISELLAQSHSRGRE
jgi:DNA-binding response OmpR family regulator